MKTSARIVKLRERAAPGILQALIAATPTIRHLDECGEAIGPPDYLERDGVDVEDVEGVEERDDTEYCTLEMGHEGNCVGGEFAPGRAAHDVEALTDLAVTMADTLARKLVAYDAKKREATIQARINEAVMASHSGPSRIQVEERGAAPTKTPVSPLTAATFT